jgi:hypothetical protein
LSGGATVWQVNFAANMAMALLYLPFWVGVDLPRLLAQGYKPIVAAITFFVGQLFTFAALRKGDVSVATPLLGARSYSSPSSPASCSGRLSESNGGSLL